jgi:hypothetical protein
VRRKLLAFPIDKRGPDRKKKPPRNGQTFMIKKIVDPF